ncbi:MAG TPA: hypothetical protein IAB55_04925 [Candidatus Merdivicinus faecavium]|nr:hypothetical protein [Candidatus Merdivicinus faecavium]
MKQILTYIRKNPWKALRWPLFAVCLVAYLVYTGLQLFTVRQYYGVIRAALEQIEFNGGFDVGLDFSDTRIADDRQLQEQICEEMNPVSIRGVIIRLPFIFQGATMFFLRFIMIGSENTVSLYICIIFKKWTADKSALQLVFTSMTSPTIRFY